MAVLRVALLLDGKPDVLPDCEQDDRATTVLSFALKEPAVQAALLQYLEGKHGADHFSPSRTDLLEKYSLIYSEIDWSVYSRLRHLRNLGIAHLTLSEVTRSVTMAELRAMVGIIIRLALTLQHLLQTNSSLHETDPEECREQIKAVIKPSF